MALKAIINADVFDGKNEKLKEHSTIVIEDNLVKEITTNNISTEQFDEIIDASGKTVIPGLTDAHVHLGFSVGSASSARSDEIAIVGAYAAKEMLYRGFTTVRDAGGLVYGLKKGIDEGYTEGPRIFPSHAFISQTSGHGDSRSSRADYRIVDHVYTEPSLQNGTTIIADGVSEVLRAVRENLFLGASQIKIMAGGGCSSIYDPIETVQYTFEEMKAAVDAASDYGTYVMAHLYTPKAMQRAVKAGVKSLEHGHLLDEETAKVIAGNGVFLAPMPNFTKPESGFPDEKRQKKMQLVVEGTFREAELAEKYGINVLFGTDFIFQAPGKGDFQLQDLSHYKKMFGSYKGLVSATGNIYELNRLTTYQNPYPDGKIGVLEEGSYADILIVDGNPVQDLDVLADKNNLRVIIKDGKVYKNTLD